MPIEIPPHEFRALYMMEEVKDNGNQGSYGGRTGPEVQDDSTRRGLREKVISSPCDLSK